MPSPPASALDITPAQEAFIGSHHHPILPSERAHWTYVLPPHASSPTVIQPAAAAATTPSAAHRLRTASHGTNSRKNSFKAIHVPSHAPARVQRPRLAALHANVNGTRSPKDHSDVRATDVKGADAMIRTHQTAACGRV